MSPIRKNGPSRKQKNKPVEAAPPPSNPPQDSLMAPNSYRMNANWISFGLIALSLFFLIHKGTVVWGKFFLVLAALAQFGQMIWAGQWRLSPKPNNSAGSSDPNKSIEPPRAIGPRQTSFLWFLLMGAAGIFFFLNLLVFPSHSWMFPSVQALPFGSSYWGLLTAWVLIVIAMTRMPNPETPKDLSPRISRWLFLLILGLGVFLVSYRPLWPIGALYEDNIIHTTTSRLVNQLGDWKLFWDAGIASNWPPFNSMFASFIWLFNPEMTGMAAQKVANVLYEVAFIFFIYLGGKEAVNRRAGLFAAALCAVCHPIITKSVGGLLGNSHAVLVVLAIWLFFRAMNRPKTANFLWWGAAVALSIYAYLVNRPFMFFTIIGALAWILIQRKEERNMDRPTFFLVAGTLGAFVLYMVYTNKFYAFDNILSRTIDAAAYLFPCLILGALWIMGLYLWPRVFNSGKHPFLSGWIAATWLAMILSYPRLADVYEQMVLNQSGIAQGASFKSIGNFIILFDSNSTDWPNHHVFGDSYFGPLEFTLGSIGLAFMFARPTLSRLYLGCVFALSFAVWLYSISYHTQRLDPCTGPFLLLAGLVLEQVWCWLCALTRSRLARVLFVGGFVGLVAWTAQAEFDQIHVQWADRFLDSDVAIWRHAVWDEDQGNHVFIGPNAVFGRGGYFLYENKPVEILQTNNVITLDTNEKLRDLAIYLRQKDGNAADQQFKTRIQNLFPDAKWEKLYCPWDTSLGMGTLAVRCVIPAADLLKPQDLFSVQTVPSPCWTRSYFNIENSLSPGILEWKSRIAQADAPAPVGELSKPDNFVRYEATITVGQSGDYELVCNASNLTVVSLDGKKIIHMIFPYTANYRYSGPGETEVRSVHLSQGTHQIQVTNSTQIGNNLADIRWRHSGDKNVGTPIWNSSSWQ